MTAIQKPGVWMGKAYSTPYRLLFLGLAALFLILLGCNNPFYPVPHIGPNAGKGENPLYLSSAKEITGISIPGASAAIDSGSTSINVTAPHGTDLEEIDVTIEHTGESVTFNSEMKSGTPATFLEVDFSAGSQEFRANAADGSTKAYKITVTVSAAPPEIVAVIGSNEYTTLDAAIKAANLEAGGGDISLKKSVSVPEQGMDANTGYVITKNIRILPIGGVLSINAEAGVKALFTVNSGATLTLNGGGFGQSLTLDGQNKTATLGRCGVYTSGGLIIENNLRITGFNNTSAGGSVYVAGSGVFTMRNDAILSGNGSNAGGGVYVSGARAKFFLNGGEIAANSATGRGGGVHIAEGDFTMSGGTVYGSTGTNTANQAPDGGASLYVALSSGTALYAPPLTAEGTYKPVPTDGLGCTNDTLPNM
jgi:ribosome-associated protein YbcJ (S4-like RNA binding protein)